MRATFGENLFHYTTLYYKIFYSAKVGFYSFSAIAYVLQNWIKSADPKLPEGNCKRQALKYAVHFSSSANLGRETDLENEGTYSSQGEWHLRWHLDCD